MKNYLLIIFLLTAIQGFCKEKKPDPKDVKIDSLKKANDSLSIKLDSVSKGYLTLYSAIKEKVLQRDFDPAMISAIIDSLRAKRDSSFLANSTAGSIKDSMSYISTENYKLKALNEDDNNKNRIYSELKQLKQLLDDKILTFTEFDEMKKKLLDKW